jgi:flagellar biosynthesis protein FlhG
MHDQANDLRRLVQERTAYQAHPSCPRPKLMLVTGGKGGVGTTTVAVNLAVALAESQLATVLVDADPQRGDATMLCGVEERYTLSDVLQARRALDEVLQRGPGELRVVPAAWARKTTFEASDAEQERLIRQLLGLGDQADITVVDAGNGPNRLVERFWRAADVRVVVTRPEVQSVMDAYASIKILAASDDTASILTLVNMAGSRAEADEVHRRVAQACQRFLAVRVDPAGSVLYDPVVAAAGRVGRAFVATSPRGRSARRFRRLALSLAQPHDGIGRFHPRKEKLRQTANNREKTLNPESPRADVG